MKGKRILYSEPAYFVGIFVLALGTALMEKADFGMSMVVAPAYLLHLKISEYLPFFSFGMSEYVFQAALLGLLALVMRKFKTGYLLSFATAFFYGLVLDGALSLVGLLPFRGILWRVIFYCAGLVTCAIGVALLLHTYFPPEAYELVVKELSQKFHATVGKTKTVYDCCSCFLSVVLSLVFFRSFVGVKWGTILCAAVNGWLIGKVSGYLENNFLWKDAFPWRKKLQ